MVWRQKYMVKSVRSLRKVSGGSVHLQKLYSTDGSIGNLRFKKTAMKGKPSKNKHAVAVQSDDLTLGQGATKPAAPVPGNATRKKILEELGEMLSGKKK